MCCPILYGMSSSHLLTKGLYGTYKSSNSVPTLLFPDVVQLLRVIYDSAPPPIVIVIIVKLLAFMRL